MPAIRLSFALLLLAMTSFAAVPAWVQPGVSVSYDGISSGMQNGQPVNGVQTLVVMTVSSVAGNAVTGRTVVTSPTIPGWNVANDWTCVDGSRCDWRFWVDPRDAVASVKGPNGEVYTDGGALPYNFNGYSDPEGALMYYQNGQTNVEYHLAYSLRTGLILSYAEIFPSQRTYLYFKSVNRDLSGYQPPAQAPLGGNTAGTCGGLFAILAAAGAGLAVKRA